MLRFRLGFCELATCYHLFDSVCHFLLLFVCFGTCCHCLSLLPLFVYISLSTVWHFLPLLVHVWKSRGCNFVKSKAKPPHAIVRLEPRGGVKREPRGIQKGTKGNQADRQISGNGHWQFIYIYSLFWCACRKLTRLHHRARSTNPTYGRQIYTPPPRWDFRNRPPSHQTVPRAKTASRGGGVYNLRALKHRNFIHHHRPENLSMPNLLGNPRESRIPLGAVVVYRDPFRTTCSRLVIVGQYQLMNTEPCGMYIYIHIYIYSYIHMLCKLELKQQLCTTSTLTR